MVGATTRAGLLTSPLRDRFGIVMRLEFYNTKDLARHSQTLGGHSRQLLADEQGVMSIAKRSRGTPRIANRLLRRVRDYAEVKGDGTINQKTAGLALDMLEVDEHGLDTLDRNLLLAVMQKFDGGPVGIDSLAAALAKSAVPLKMSSSRF